MARTASELAWARNKLKELDNQSKLRETRKALKIAIDALNELPVLRKQIIEQMPTCEGCEGRTSHLRGKLYQCLYCCRNYGDEHDMVK